MTTDAADSRITYRRGDRPQYATLARAIDSLYFELIRALGKLWAAVFKALQPTGVKAEEEPFDYHEASELLIDRAVEEFLTAVAGPDRSKSGFVGSGTQDGLLQTRAVFTYQVGIQRAADQLGHAPTLQDQWHSPAVQQMLDHAFERLSEKGRLRLENIRDDIHGILVSGTDAGLSPLAVGRQLGNLFDNYQGWEFQRLARTESAFAAEAGSRDQYRDLGVTKVEILIDVGACDECQEYGGEVVDIDDEGSQPPYHPNCLCSTAPVTSEEDNSESGQSEPE